MVTTSACGLKEKGNKSADSGSFVVSQVVKWIFSKTNKWELCPLQNMVGLKNLSETKKS